MGKAFSYTFKCRSADLFKLLEKEIHSQGIKFEGDEKSGHMKGKGFEVEYNMSESSSGTELSITVNKKPFILPWMGISSMLDLKIREWKALVG